MTRFTVYFNEVMDRLEELERENDRLRAREQALQLQLDAMSSLLLDVHGDCVAARHEANVMRPIVEAVTEDVTDSETGDCCFCGWSGYPHEPNCPTAQARAFVAAHPATATTAGEAESAGGDDE